MVYDLTALRKLPLYFVILAIAMSAIAPLQVYAFEVTRDNITFSGDFIGSGTQKSKVGDSFTLKAHNPGPEARWATVRVEKPDGTIIEWGPTLLNPGDNDLGSVLADKPGTYKCRLTLHSEETILEGSLYAYEEGDGGVWVPVDKFGLLTPYIGLASTIVVATAATAICVRRVKRRKER